MSLYNSPARRAKTVRADVMALGRAGIVDHGLTKRSFPWPHHVELMGMEQRR
jgi:hypothetical protein